MIRKLAEKDREDVLLFLSTEPSFNLFLIGDILNFGFEQEFIDVWGYFNDFGGIEGILLRYYENFIPYYKNELFDISNFKRIIKEYHGKKIISGKEEIVSNFKDVMKNSDSRSTYFCELVDKDNLLNFNQNIKCANEKDAKIISDLLEDIEEFISSDTNSIDRIKHTINSNTGRIYYIENDKNEAISVAQTTAENPYSAMIVGVATRKDERNKGLVSQCLSKLCFDLINEGKTLCLFYDNPDAGKIYLKLGFKTLGKWMMLVESKQ